MIKKIILLLFCLWISTEIFAYTPSSYVLEKTKNLSDKINVYILSQTTEQKIWILKLLTEKLPILQARLFDTKNIERMYLFEYVRRHLPGSEMIDTADLIDDDNLGVTWTHAPRGFDIIYTPYMTPSMASLDEEKKFSTLINGSYFSRTEGWNYHAGLLWLNNQRQTPFVSDDPQLTHILCLDAGRISLWKNSEYTSENMLAWCTLALQAGPLIYELRDGKIVENLAPKTYIWLAHTRTVLVVFTRPDGSEDIWFLTFYKKMTLAQVRDVVLADTRFFDTYRDLRILNLDGGSSVAYMSRVFPQLNFGTQKKLPIVFGIY